MDVVTVSKFLSYILRHNPDSIGMSLDRKGWLDIDVIIERAKEYKGYDLTRELIIKAVAENNKKRFEVEGNRIRACQGHSIEVDVELKFAKPPTKLYHGTALKNVESILKKGLVKGNRLHVHLSADIQTATSVGQRHGAPIVFEVDCAQMFKDFHNFWLSKNGVWLTDNVPPKYLKKL
jgi:putative RNA 2'-phosphotransferase